MTRRVRLVFVWLWILFTGLLALLALNGVIGVLFFWDSRFERGDRGFEAGLVVVSAAVCLAALDAAVRVLRGRPRRPGWPGGATLTVLAVLLILFWALVGFASDSR